jgi:hypothetical protein
VAHSTVKFTFTLIRLPTYLLVKGNDLLVILLYGSLHRGVLGFCRLRLKAQTGNIVREYKSRCATYQHRDYDAEKDICLLTKADRALIKTFRDLLMLVGPTSRVMI